MSNAPHPKNARLDALIGTWRTCGEVLGEDGSTPVAAVDGSDAYEWLGGHFVIHRIDVHMGGEPVRGLEIIGPFDPETGAYPTRAYDDRGGIQTATADVTDDGVWTFRADGAEATLRTTDDGQSMRADWLRTDDGGATWRPWLRLRFTRA